jgi:ParB/RepB/Spo0J family partition protein
MTTAMTSNASSQAQASGYDASRPRPKRSSFDNFFDIELEMAQASSQGQEAVAIPVPGKQHVAIALSAIVERSRLQTRRAFDPERDAEDGALVESLRARGQDSPVLLEQLAGCVPAQYRLRDGHRRVDALRHLGCLRVEAVVVQEGTAESDLITLTANVRKNLSPMEWARAIQHLLAAGMSAADIARKIGVSQPRVSNGLSC